jgi:catechol 2,3-dioxygenase
MTTSDYPLPDDVRIGHVHLRVSDLDRAVAFYRDGLGFGVTMDARPHGIPAVFLAAGSYHHHIAVNTFDGAGAAPPPPGRTGLYHFAIVYPDRMALARAAARVVAHGGTLDHGRDHGGTLSVYLKDPDGNGVELYYDRPRASWFDAHGRVVLKNEPFDVAALIAEAVATPALLS